MAGPVLILGAKGRFGRAAAEAFARTGWHRRLFARAWPGVGEELSDETRIAGDAFDAQAVAKAAEGCAVIVNALNPPYPAWRRDVPRITAAVLAAAQASGATVMVPGNVYNYGAGMPERLAEDTAHAPTTRKGQVREQMEAAYAAAADERGVRTIIVRAGDFIERAKTGNWFDTYIAAKAAKGQVVYPGPLDRVHAWAYLPDIARVMASLAIRRARFAPFETFGFPGYALTGRELVDAIEAALGRPLQVKGFAWPMLKLMAPFSAMAREVVEMAYLWEVPHAIDGAKLSRALPGFAPTPLETAMRDALGVVDQD